MFAEAGDDGQFLGMFADGIKLIGECCLELLASNVRKLGFSNEGFGLSTDKLLFKDDNPRAIGLLVFELSDLIGDLLLA